MKKGILIIGLLIVCLLAKAQDERAGVQLLGKATKRSIKLRWAPNNPSVWELANKYGYTIERVTLSENNKILKDPIREKLTPAPLKPADEQFWVGPMDTDDYVAVAAQAIFGETFELTENFSSDIAQVVNKSKELEQRFTFALFAADQSLEAAQLSGLYFEDEMIAPNTKYLYRVYANIPKQIIELDTGFVYLGMSDYKELPVPFDLTVDFSDQSAMISWDGSLVANVYNSFWVERSTDGENFEKIVENPVVNTFQGNQPKTRRIFKLDSLPSNDKLYYYRVKGIDAFGEVGPATKPVSGSGKPLFAFNARITGHNTSEAGAVEINWDFPTEGEKLLQSFEVKRFHPQTKTYEPIEEGLAPTSRSFIDERARSTNYYVISSKDKYGNGNESFPYLVQLEDSIPPVQPVGLKGEIDTTGLVYLSWTPNPDADVLGYKLFKSNFASQEFIQIPGPVIETVNFVDTIALDNLTETIFYKVRALDYRYNPSEFSAVLKLEKPDLVPPSAPVFKEIKSDSSGILITWVNSTSADLSQHVLYRRSQNESQWKVIKVVTLDDKQEFFLDRDVKHRTAYAYTMIAVDDDNLESSPANPVSLKWISRNPYPEVNQLFYDIDQNKKKVTIKWSYNQQNVEQYQVYRSTNEGPLKLIGTVASENREIEDTYTLNAQSITYKVVANFNGGDQSKMGKGLEIEL